MAREPPGGGLIHGIVVVWFISVRKGVQFMVQPNPAQGLLSPCHQSPLIGARQDGRPVGCCEECGQPVTRIHEPTNTEEWLDGHPPNTPRALRPVNRRIH